MTAYTASSGNAPNNITSLAFANAMAGQRRILRYLDSTNQAAWKGLWPSAPPAFPYAVALASRSGRFRTVFIDLDKRGAPIEVGLIAALLDRCGIGHAICRSGGTDRFHVIFTVAGGGLSRECMRALADGLTARFRSVDTRPLVSGSSAAGRPPLAPHRNGGRSEPVVSPNEALRTLQTRNGPGPIAQLLVELGVPTWRAEWLVAEPVPDSALRTRLNQQGFDLICNRRNKTYGDTSASGRLWSALLYMINAGFDWPQVAVKLRWMAELSVAKRPDRGNWDGYLHREYERAEKFVKNHPAPHDRQSVLDVLAEIDEAVNLAEWPGRAARSDLAVMQALLSIAFQVARIEVSASIRQLSVETGLSIPTVHATLHRLVRDGWLRRGELRGRNGLAASYTLRLHNLNTISLTSGRGVSSVQSVGEELRATMHEAFHGKLGAWHCWAVLKHLGPSTTSEVAAAMGLSPSGARRHLKFLHDLGLAIHERRHWTSLEADLDAVAESRGTTGVTELKADRFSEDSRRYRELMGFPDPNELRRSTSAQSEELPDPGEAA